jgi:tetratricopeptide (TPR) repeat protein
MAVFKCKLCGGTIEPREGGIGICDSCGTKQTISNTNDEKKMNLLDRANHFRMQNEFDKALAIYEQVLAEDTNDSDIYYAITLCRYGVTYVDDPKTKNKVPTINRMQNKMFTKDPDYEMAVSKAEPEQAKLYKEEGEYIDKVQTGIMDITKNEKPYDVFICYKETDDNGERTRDSVLANDLYHGLTNDGFKVFFAKITLEGKLGTAYEPYIFSALNSSKVMVVLGTKKEYFDAVWVKNEWSRFLSLMKDDPQKTLIPAYKDMDPYDLPDEFSNLQALDMSKLGFMQDLIKGIRKLIIITNNYENDYSSAPNSIYSNIDSLLERTKIFLNSGKFKEAHEYCEKVLDIDPKNFEAYFYELMAETKSSTEEQLQAFGTSKDELVNATNEKGDIKTLYSYDSYANAYNFANDMQKKKLNDIASENTYRKANSLIDIYAWEYDKVANLYMKVIEYKNCKDKLYSLAAKKFERGDSLETVVNILTKIKNYKNCDQIINCINDDLTKQGLPRGLNVAIFSLGFVVSISIFLIFCMAFNYKDEAIITVFAPLIGLVGACALTYVVEIPKKRIRHEIENMFFVDGREIIQGGISR